MTEQQPQPGRGRELAGARIAVVGATGVLGSLVAAELERRGARLLVVGRDAERLAAPRHRGAGRGGPRRRRRGATRSRRRRASTSAGSTGWSTPPVSWPSGPSSRPPTRWSRSSSSPTSSGPLFLLRRVLPLLEESHGFVLQLSAVVAERPMPRMAAYSASKAALSAVATALRTELRRSRVEVYDVRPPHTETGLAGRPLAGEAPRLPAGPSTRRRRPVGSSTRSRRASTTSGASAVRRPPDEPRRARSRGCSCSPRPHLGFQLTVDLVVYPALGEVPREAWFVAHDRHSRRITPVVALIYPPLVAGPRLDARGASRRRRAPGSRWRAGCSPWARPPPSRRRPTAGCRRPPTPSGRVLMRRLDRADRVRTVGAVVCVVGRAPAAGRADGTRKAVRCRRERCLSVAHAPAPANCLPGATSRRSLRSRRMRGKSVGADLSRVRFPTLPVRDGQWFIGG